MVKVTGAPGYEDFEGEEIGRISLPWMEDEMTIVLDSDDRVHPIPAKYVEEV